MKAADGSVNDCFLEYLQDLTQTELLRRAGTSPAKEKSVGAAVSCGLIPDLSESDSNSSYLNYFSVH